MMDALKLEYLEAMEVPVWVGRDPSATGNTVSSQLRMGPGSSSVLLICRDDVESASPLAADICRSLPEPPVWAWPSVEGEGTAIEDAISENLFTSVLVFGGGLADVLFHGSRPETLDQARIVTMPRLGEIARSAQQKRACWRLLCGSGMMNKP